MALQHLSQLFGKVHLRVVPFLIIDISNRILQLRYADSECRVSVLPRERSSRQMIVDPFRRAAFDQLNGFGNGNGRRQERRAWAWSGIPPTARALNLFWLHCPDVVFYQINGGCFIGSNSHKEFFYFLHAGKRCFFLLFSPRGHANIYLLLIP
jgi:hypothetical protein